MTLANQRDVRMFEGVEVAYRQWPATIDGDMEIGETVDGQMRVTARPLTDEERSAWEAAARAALEAENESTVDQAITDALTELRNLVNAPALPVVPDGTMTTAQLSNALRTLRNEAQATRAGAQRVADILLKTIRLVRGDFDGID